MALGRLIHSGHGHELDVETENNGLPRLACASATAQADGNADTVPTATDWEDFQRVMARPRKRRRKAA